MTSGIALPASQRRSSRGAWALGAASRHRWLHPGAWWAWALALAVAASRTANPLLLCLIVAVAATVVAARKPSAPWAGSFGFFLRLGLAIIALRVLVQLIFAAPIGTTVLLTTPGLTLPSWMAGVRIGGPIMLESLLLALVDGLRLATILACIGAANSLASPSRLLKSVPAALYEVGVSVVVAMTVTPQLVADVGRVRRARVLRGRPIRGPRALASAALPVLEGALERSVSLAAAMDARGYGRRAGTSRAQARSRAGLLLAGLVASVIGTYGLVGAGAPPTLGLPMLVVGIGLAVLSLALSGRTRIRTRYRPDPWWAAEWAVVASGAIAAAAFIAASWWWPAGLNTTVDPPSWPALPLLPTLGLLVALLPAVIAPPIPSAQPADAARVHESGRGTPGRGALRRRAPGEPVR
ncbi:MAG: energy-coupling factor transporter transmembrane component T [Actinomycetales bacterium]